MYSRDFFVCEAETAPGVYISFPYTVFTGPVQLTGDGDEGAVLDMCSKI